MTKLDAASDAASVYSIWSVYDDYAPSTWTYASAGIRSVAFDGSTGNPAMGCVSLTNRRSCMCPERHRYFGSPRGNKLGLIAASLFLPSIPSAFVGDFLAYRYGRRIAVWTGSILIIIGAFVNGFANSLGMFIGGTVFSSFAVLVLY